MTQSLARAASGNTTVHLGRIHVQLPVALPTVTFRTSSVAVDVNPATMPLIASHRVVGTAKHQIETAHAAPTTAKPRPALAAASTSGAGPTAATAPGLISVVPVGPLPTALPPRVAMGQTEASAPVATSNLGHSLPAPPPGFWFALVMVILVLGTATYLVGDRRAYNVALSITKR